MKYLALILVSVLFIATLLTSCSKYHSKSYDSPKNQEVLLEMNDFEEVQDSPDNETSLVEASLVEVYNIKYYYLN
jgi:PBP1b-binding outer membrane lipoprotein LpoB